MNELTGRNRFSPPKNACMDTHSLKATLGGFTDPLEPTHRCPVKNKVFLKFLTLQNKSLGSWNKRWPRGCWCSQVFWGLGQERPLGVSFPTNLTLEVYNSWGKAWPGDSGCPWGLCCPPLPNRPLGSPAEPFGHELSWCHLASPLETVCSCSPAGLRPPRTCPAAVAPSGLTQTPFSVHPTAGFSNGTRCDPGTQCPLSSLATCWCKV